MGVGIQNLSILLIFLAALVSYKKNKKLKISNRYGLLFLVLYPLGLLLSSISSPNFLFSNPNIFLAIAIPLLLSTHHNLDKRDLEKILKAFIISVSLLSFIKFSAVLYQLGPTELLVLPQNQLAKIIVNYSYLNLSMYVGTAMLFSAQLFYSSSLIKRIFIVLNFLFLFLFLTLLSSRTVLLATMIVSFSLFLVYTPKAKKILLIGCFMSLIISTSIIVYVFDAPIVEKIKEAVNFQNEYSNIKNNWGGRIMRQEIWGCAISLIKQKPIFGYGFKNVQNRLNECYEENSKHPVLYRGISKKNAHNQFLQITLSTGLIGLFCFLSVLFYAFRNAVAKRSPLVYLFVIFAAMCFLTESHLERNHTIYLFYFFIALFFQPLKDDKNTISY